MGSIENLMLFECNSPETATKFYERLARAIVPQIDLNYEGNQIVDVSLDKQFVKAYVYGESKRVYWLGFEWAEASNHTIAFIGSLDSMIHLSVDPTKILPYQTLSTEDWRMLLEELVEEFWRYANCSTFTPIDLRRIIRMCHLGTDKSVEEAVFDVLKEDVEIRDRTPDGYKLHYVLAMRRIQTLSYDCKDSLYGDRLLHRVMLHLLYLGVVSPRRDAKMRKFISAVKRISLG